MNMRNSEQLEKAIDDYTKAIQLDPNDADAYTGEDKIDN